MMDGYKEEAPRVVSLKMQVLVAHAAAANIVIASGLDDIATKDSDGEVVHRYERFIDIWVPARRPLAMRCRTDRPLQTQIKLRTHPANHSDQPASGMASA
jgi:hypothetical protein